MTSQGKYLARARDLLSKAEAEADPKEKARLETLAAHFKQLSEFEAGLTIEFPKRARSAD
jgi:hypothetical protein